MKSGNLNFLEHSGPLQACKGAALPLYVHIHTYMHGVATLYIHIFLIWTLHGGQLLV